MKTSINALLETTENSKLKQANLLMNSKTLSCVDRSLNGVHLKRRTACIKTARPHEVWDAA